MTETTTTEQPRTDGGQFGPSEPLTGRAGLEDAAGFVPFKEDDRDEAPAEELTARQAANELADERRTRESDIKTVGLNLPKNVTLTLDQASKALSDERDADKALADDEDADRIRKEVDKLRGEGEEQEEKPAKAKEAKAKDADTVDADEPDLEKVLSHPKVREALDKHVTEHETARQAYTTGLQEVGKARIAGIIAVAPELANLPLNQWRNALAAMDPARARAAAGQINAFAQVEAAHAQLQQQNAAREQARFQTYAKDQDARFADMVKGERDMAAIEAQIPKTLKALGVDPAEFLRAGSVEGGKFLRSAAAQAILVKAAKYDMLEAARKAGMAKVVPHVQRPGTAQPRVNATVSRLDSLRSKANSTGKLRDFANLLAAERAARK
jgi:hypothetical protein